MAIAINGISINITIGDAHVISTNANTIVNITIAHLIANIVITNITSIRATNITIDIVAAIIIASTILAAINSSSVIIIIITVGALLG